MRHMRLGCDGVGVYATGPVPAGRRNALTHQFARAGHARDVPRPIVHDGTCATAHAIGKAVTTHRAVTERPSTSELRSAAR